jgi:uncharacterized cupredoxin-like copper-binding protein
MVRRTALCIVAGIFVLSAGLTACGSDSESSVAATDTTTATTVAATLQEFAIGTDKASVPAGSVTFDVTNTGPDDVHEFVIIRTDLGAADLPVDKDGAALEEDASLAAIDEIEDIAVDASASLTVDMEAGSYVLVCNIVQEEPDGSLEAHYAEGMRVGFTVT